MAFLLQQALLHPSGTLHLDANQLGQLISQARSSRLMASLALELRHAGIEHRLPVAVSRHLHSAIAIHEKQKKDLQYDCEKIRFALQTVGEKLVMLKGGAYLLANLGVGSGRLITDIDILVPHDRIEAAESALNKAGWQSGDISAYDDHYYRKWGHEIPPLTNIRRGTTLDVHHNILPPTTGPKVNASLLFENLIEVAPGVFTLCWQDMVIHSATHLFHEGEFHHGLRDLWDLDRMLREFPKHDSHFWEGLVARAAELQLVNSLFQGLNYAQRVFATPVPEAAMKEASSWPRKVRKPLMDFLFLRAFRPDYPDCKLPFTDAALTILYVRSHYLRMPLYLLAPHLVRKAWLRRFDSSDKTPEAG